MHKLVFQFITRAVDFQQAFNSACKIWGMKQATFLKCMHMCSV